MTKDTERALEIIAPMAKELNIDVKADESLLYLNGQAIGIGCNSTYATLMEFIGFVFVKDFTKRSTRLPESYIRDVVKRHWLTGYQLRKVMESINHADGA